MGQQRRRLLQADTFSATKALLVQPKTTSSNDSPYSADDGISSGASSAGSDVGLAIGLSAGAMIMAGVGVYPSY
jgi:hypothetical protein